MFFKWLQIFQDFLEFQARSVLKMNERNTKKNVEKKGICLEQHRGSEDHKNTMEKEQVNGFSNFSFPCFVAF